MGRGIETKSKSEAKRIATQKLAENKAKIEELIDECEYLSHQLGIDFSLEDFGYMTEDEALDAGWSSSSC